MRILVSDNLSELGIGMFAAEEGFQVDVKTGLSPDELREIIGNYDALVIRSATKVTEEVLAAAKNLKVVGRAGIGLDNVDMPAATKRGIVVMNTPTGNVITTAEHTIAMMLSLSRNIPTGTASLKSGQWEKKRLQGREVVGGDRFWENRLHRGRPGQGAQDAGDGSRSLRGRGTDRKGRVQERDP